MLRNLLKLSQCFLVSFDIISVGQFVRHLISVQIDEMQLTKLTELIHDLSIRILVDSQLVQFNVLRPTQM